MCRQRRRWVDVTDQRRFGDFTSGRYGWLLDDVRPVYPPVSAYPCHVCNGEAGTGHYDNCRGCLNLPRGCVVEWDGRRWMAFGGGVSIDVARRTTGFDWWPDETATPEQIDRACQALSTGS